jgi:hypothetical protein
LNCFLPRSFFQCRGGICHQIGLGGGELFGRFEGFCPFGGAFAVEYREAIQAGLGADDVQGSAGVL